ncbi:MAG: creatininase family protein [Opitutaceae bacterium]|nr:creatininase family protein [Opitutaceae bacterium]
MSMTWLANGEGTTAWANHTWEEFASLTDKHRHLVILPLHGIADHGMGLPLDVEEVIGGELLRRAVARSLPEIQLRVLPPLRFVLAPIPASFFGIDPETAHDLILEIASGVHAAGFSKLVFWNTSPWNAEFMDVAARDVRVAYGLQTFYINLSGLDLDFHPAAPGRAALQAMGAYLCETPPSGDTRAGDVTDRLFRPGFWRQPDPVVPDKSRDPRALLEKTASHFARLLYDIDAKGKQVPAGHNEAGPHQALPQSIAPSLLQPGRLWPAYRSRYLPALTRGELEAWADKAQTLVILPAGAIEQHGYHLPVGVDSLLGQAYLEAALPKLDAGSRVLVAPPITFGKSNEHEGFPGTISLSAKTLRRLLLSLVRQLHDLGFRFFAVLNTHGGNSATVVYTLREIQSVFGVRAGMLSSGYSPPLSDIERDFGFHAGEWETSLMMAAAADLVRRDRAVCEYPARPDDPGELRPENAPAIASWISSDISRSGTMGDATAATEEKGRRWMEEWSTALARQISELARSART